MCSATHRDSGQKRAIKTIARSKIKNWDRFLTEFKILQTLVSRNALKPGSDYGNADD